MDSIVEERIVRLDPAVAASVAVLMDCLVPPGIPRYKPPSPADDRWSREVRRLVIILLRRAKEGPGVVTDAELRRALGAVTTMPARARSGIAVGDYAADSERDAAAVRVLSLLMDYAALEEMDASVSLEAQGACEWSLRWKSMTREAAHLRLLDPIYRSIDRLSRQHPLFALERSACAWWFRSLMPESPENEERVHARMIREWEWRLTDRGSIATRRTVLKMESELGFLETLGPRARRMGISARRSRAGVFVVREGTGADLTIEDIAKHERLVLREHDVSCVHRPGTVIVGHLYPFGPGLYLRSPGAFVFDGESVPPAEKLWEWTQILLRQRFPLAVALEWMVTKAILDETSRAPTDLPPATSRSEAREILNAFRSSMEDVGMLANPKSNGALWLEPTGEPGCFTVFGWPVDLPFAAWVERLLEIAEIAQEVRIP